MFAHCGAQSRSRSEAKNLARPLSKKWVHFLRKWHFLRSAFSKKIFSKIHFRKKVILPHCTQTGHLFSHSLFLSRAAVNRHIGHAKACRSAGMGYREMPIRIRAVDVMARGGGGAGPAPSIRHQAPGTQAGLRTMLI